MKENRFKDLYIIGNGFDLHHGVKSSYNHFKKWLEKNDQDLLLEMEVLWNNNFQLWSDFERALGDIDYKYVKEKFGKYLHKEHYEIKQKFQGNHPELLPSCIGNHCLEAKLRPIVKKIAHAFNRWVLTLNQDISTLNPNIDLKENAFFINFNYTETLEILYGIHTNSILHIHGKANTKDCLLFGHNKNSMQIILENTNSNECFYDTTIHDFAMWVGYLMKNVDYNLSLVSPILDKLTALENIYILGYSFNEIDSTYIRFISNNNFIYNRHPHWHISYYTEKDKIIIKEFIKTSRLNKNEFTLFKLKEIVKTDLINKNNSSMKMHL